MDNHYELGDELALLKNLLATQAEDTVKVIDLPRYREVARLACDLQAMLRKTKTSAKLTADIEPTFYIGYVTAEAPSFTVEGSGKFPELIQRADAFEVYPLTDGTLRMEFTFQSVLKPIR